MARMQALAKRVEPSKGKDQAIEIPLNKIVFDKSQPRSDFHHVDGQVAQAAQMTLQELAESIDANGLISPIIVETHEDGTYCVLVGERRTRAHLLLGRTTILATVNDAFKGDRKGRLLFQMAENINRADLSEADMASKIRFLMEGQDDSPALSQTQIAKAFGKSEGWVSRYVRFGDVELQRLWIATGIVDTVENLYRISVLPKPTQIEIQRRVALDKGDPEYLAKPLTRAFIDQVTAHAKAAKKAAKTKSEAPVLPPVVDPETSNEEGKGRDEAMTKEASKAELKAGESPKANVQTAPLSSGEEYALPPEKKSEILSEVQVFAPGNASAPVQPPVNVRMNMASLQKLLVSLAQEDVNDLNTLSLSLTLPGPLAQRIANTLAGVIVDPTEVPSVVQNEMAKL